MTHATDSESGSDTRTFHGTVLDANGHVIGSGLELDSEGALVHILPMEAGQELGAQGWITPGLVDVHCHGGGGASFPDTTDPEQIRTAIAAHRSLGTTALVASLVSMTDPLPCIEALAAACEEGELVGIHLEGPYISREKAGAQNPAAIREPDLEELRTWLEAGRGHVRTMTIAPETPGALQAAKLLMDHGARPSWGHTSADGPTTRTLLEQTAAHARSLGWDGPAQTATHLFNAMPTLQHRAPGPVAEFLRSARLGETVVEVVGDTVHVAPELVGEVIAWVGRDQHSEAGVALVSDAMSGAGMPDGSYELGSLPVTIEDGVARITTTGAIAGGTARVAEEVARLVRGGFVTMPEAIRAAVAGPARAIGVGEDAPGVTLEYAAGHKPDLVVWDADLQVQLVLREGAEV